jgi:hypothetical protein
MLPEGRANSRRLVRLSFCSDYLRELGGKRTIKRTKKNNKIPSLTTK